jgi:alcohol dehydrogenase class IV
MQPFTGQFTLPRLERVIAGPGTIDALPAELDRYRCRRAVIVTGTTLGASPLLEQLVALLGERCAAVFAGARQHVPAHTVQALRDSMRAAAADCLVSVGGGSPIDTAKCAVYATIGGDAFSRTTETRKRGEDDESLRLHDAVARRADDAGDLPVHIAVPTTLSAGEFTDVAGITDDATSIKHARFDTRLAPRTVIADPVLTLQTPPWLWAGSGIRALDHAVETLYSNRRHPISETLAERAIGMLAEHLPASIEGAAEDVLAHRGACQMAAWLAVFGVTNAGFGLSHVLGHQIGPRWNVPHGVTSSIMLPHAMRFMAAAVPSRFAGIARALGIAFDPDEPGPGASACAEWTAAFVERFGLPSRLRDVGVPAGELAGVAGIVADLMEKAAVVARPVGRGELETILSASY